MFTDFAHFKKVTQALFNSTCGGSGLKLAQYRDQVAQSLGYANIQAIKAHFDSLTDGPQIVSVILYVNETVHSKHDFYDTPEGNRKAEDYFRKVLLEYMPSYDDQDVDDCLDNGYFEDENSDYQMFITHSYK